MRQPQFRLLRQSPLNATARWCNYEENLYCRHRGGSTWRASPDGSSRATLACRVHPRRFLDRQRAGSGRDEAGIYAAGNGGQGGILPRYLNTLLPPLTAAANMNWWLIPGWRRVFVVESLKALTLYWVLQAESRAFTVAVGEASWWCPSRRRNRTLSPDEITRRVWHRRDNQFCMFTACLKVSTKRYAKGMQTQRFSIPESSSFPGRAVDLPLGVPGATTGMEIPCPPLTAWRNWRFGHENGKTPANFSQFQV